MRDAEAGTTYALAELRRELISLAAEDQRVRAQLEKERTLFDGYHPRMEAVHRHNAAFLAGVIDRHGWPGAELVGDDGADAAWLIAQHAIGEPAFQRRCLLALEDAAARGQAPRWQPAMLEDRIRVFEGRAQRYGTQLQVGDDGTVYPYPVDDPDGVEERRRAVGLEPLADRLAKAGRAPPPKDRAEYERGYEAWLRKAGWRT